MFHGPQKLKKKTVKVLFIKYRKYTSFVESCLLTLATEKEFLIFNNVQE